jgi:hypothetical protein
VLLLPTGNFPKLLLRHAFEEPLQPRKHLGDTLLVQRIHLRLPNQCFDLYQALAVQMTSQPLLNLLQHGFQKFGTILTPHVDDFVHEACLHQLLACDSLRHDQRLVGFAYPEPPHKSDRRIAFCNKTERGERREKEGMWRSVDEVREGDQRGGETDCGAVERGDKDLGVRVERMGYVEVVGDEVFEPVAARVIVL